MSIKIMTRIWESKLESHRKLLCLCLADFGDDSGGNIFPKVSTIADRTTVSVRTAQRILHDLVKIGIIRPVGKTGSGTIRYQIILEAIADYDPETKTVVEPDGGDKMTPLINGPEIPEMSPQGCQNRYPGVTPVTLRGDTAMSPDPLINHQLNHKLTINSGDRIKNDTSEELEIIQTIPELSKTWTAEKLWQAVYGQLKMDMSKAAFDTWIKQTRTVGYTKIDGNGYALLITAPNEYSREWIENRMKTTLVRIIVGITNGIVSDVRIFHGGKMP